MDKNSPKLNLSKLPITVQLAKPYEFTNEAAIEVRKGESKLHNDPNYIFAGFDKPISKML